MPRSIVAWFAVCWGLFLVAALVVGAMLIALYKETSTQRTDRASASIALACDAIVRDAGIPRGTDGTSRTIFAAAVDQALTSFPNVEGGIWQSGVGSLAYAFPSYEGSGRKTDLPQAEEPTIRQIAESASAAQRPVEWKRNSPSQVLLISACPIADRADISAWAMTRVVTVGGRPFLLATTGLGLLMVVLLGSAALLGRVLWRWSHRLLAIEDALSSGAENLPVLELTGQRDLDRIVAAINGAGAKAAEARDRSVRLLQRVADGERLAALGRVAAGVAHEIRNPIAAMRLKAENALANESDRSRSRDALQVVVEQVGRMDLLLQNLLQSVQRPDIKREAVLDIRSFLQQHAALFREQAGSRRVTVESEGTIGSPIQFDTAQIGRALDNLILNAIQNSDDGTHIVLRADHRGGKLQVSVADCGHGVPSHIRVHLFEPFATGRPDGTGLGLAIVREAAEAHGGRVTLQHRADGTTFVLEFPAETRQ